MNINIFFLIIIGGLLAIFTLFEPIDIKKQKASEIPILELEKFKLTELSVKGLSSIMEGSHGFRYSDRYSVLDLDYTDNTNELLDNIKAKNGLYKGNVIDLNGDVVYFREDGLTFKTQNGRYNQKTDVVQALTKYVSHMKGNRATGSSIEYNNALGTIKSKNIVANYKLKER